MSARHDGLIGFEQAPAHPGSPGPPQGETNFATGAVRSADANRTRFDLISPVAMIRLAETYAEGAAKYGANNWLLGFPVHDLINHVLRHIFLYQSGDRSEPHLPHALWGVAAAIHSAEMWPELNEPHTLGPGCTLTDAARAELDRFRADKAARQVAGTWPREFPTDSGEVAKIVAARGLRPAGEAGAPTGEPIQADSSPDEPEPFASVMARLGTKGEDWQAYSPSMTREDWMAVTYPSGKHGVYDNAYGPTEEAAARKLDAQIQKDKAAGAEAHSDFTPAAGGPSGDGTLDAMKALGSCRYDWAIMPADDRNGADAFRAFTFTGGCHGRSVNVTGRTVDETICRLAAKVGEGVGG